MFRITKVEHSQAIIVRPEETKRLLVVLRLDIRTLKPKPSTTNNAYTQTKYKQRSIKPQHLHMNIPHPNVLRTHAFPSHVVLVEPWKDLPFLETRIDLDNYTAFRCRLIHIVYKHETAAGCFITLSPEHVYTPLLGKPSFQTTVHQGSNLSIGKRASECSSDRKN